MLYINTTSSANTVLSDPIYENTIVRGIYTWIMTYNVPQQAAWLTDALDWSLLFILRSRRRSTAPA